MEHCGIWNSCISGIYEIGLLQATKIVKSKMGVALAIHDVSLRHDIVVGVGDGVTGEDCWHLSVPRQFV